MGPRQPDRAPPETRYARAEDGTSIAYQVVGSGPLDLVWVPGWISNVETAWEEPTFARFLQHLASFARLILFDKRGTGLSDRVAEHQLPSLETRMADLTAVCDAAHAPRPALLGISEGAAMCTLFAATYPERTSALILIGGFARRLQSPDFAAGVPTERYEAELEQIRGSWGGPVGLDARAPSRAQDPRFRDAWARILRSGASPSAAIALMEMNAQIDVRDILRAIRVPTLVIHRTGDRTIPVACGRQLADGIPEASLAELPGDDHLPWVGDADAVLTEIETFLTGATGMSAPATNRVLATVVFTDIVASTRHATALGDEPWADVLEAHDRRLRAQLTRFDGREIKTVGDGFLATFDGPARAVRCALAMVETVSAIGLTIRVGVHTGEIELAEGDIHGVAVHIGARLVALAEPGEVLVSRTVRDLVAGSGLVFADRGVHELKGVPDTWQVYAADPSAPSAR